MYKYVLNSVVKIPMMFAKYFEYYTIILRGAVFYGHAVHNKDDGGDRAVLGAE